LEDCVSFPVLRAVLTNFSASVGVSRGSHCKPSRSHDLFVIPLNIPDLQPVTGLPSFGSVIYNVTVLSFNRNQFQISHRSRWFQCPKSASVQTGQRAQYWLARSQGTTCGEVDSSLAVGPARNLRTWPRKILN
jgi:hypothetical protein